MTPAQIAADVDRGLDLLAAIKTAEDELKTIVQRLEQAALEGQQEPLNDANREGMQFRARGTKATVPVIITADSVMQTFADGSPAHARIADAAKGKLEDFFKRTVTFKNTCRDGKAFRAEAAAILGDDAPAFISACLSRDKNGIPRNSIKIEWDRAEPTA